MLVLIFFCSCRPMYWDTMIPVTVAIAPLTKVKINCGFPPISTEAMAVLPNCPTISWSIMEKDDCNIACKATGNAIVMASLKNGFRLVFVVIKAFSS